MTIFNKLLIIYVIFKLNSEDGFNKPKHAANSLKLFT
jgi:hypothetical protein